MRPTPASLLREASAALEIIGEKLVERVEAVEEGNVTAAREMNEALHAHAVEQAASAVEALEAHRAFAALHAPWLDDSAPRSPPRRSTPFQKWTES